MHKCFFCKQGKYFSEWSTKGAVLVLTIFILSLFSIGFHMQTYKENKQYQKDIKNLCRESWEKTAPNLKELKKEIKNSLKKFKPISNSEKRDLICDNYNWIRYNYSRYE